MLAVLAAATFAARPVGRGNLVSVAAAFVLTAAALPANSVPPLTLIGTAIALVAVLELARPAWTVLPALGAGAVAAVWASLMHGLGLESAPAWLVAAALLAAALALGSKHSGMRAAMLREEALLLVAGLAMVAAAGPVVSAGWESAVAFKTEPVQSDGMPLSLWLVGFVVVCVAIGACYTMRRRR